MQSGCTIPWDKVSVPTSKGRKKAGTMEIFIHRLCRAGAEPSCSRIAQRDGLTDVHRLAASLSPLSVFNCLGHTYMFSPCLLHTYVHQQVLGAHPLHPAAAVSKLAGFCGPSLVFVFPCSVSRQVWISELGYVGTHYQIQVK